MSKHKLWFQQAVHCEKQVMERETVMRKALALRRTAKEQTPMKSLKKAAEVGLKMMMRMSLMRPRQILKSKRVRRERVDKLCSSLMRAGRGPASVWTQEERQQLRRAQEMQLQGSCPSHWRPPAAMRNLRRWWPAGRQRS